MKSPLLLNLDSIATKSPHFSTKKSQKSLAVHIIQSTQDRLEFDIIGIDSSLANALRRIMIAEVPTMAIEKVYVMNNTSVIPDEVLAHRLGLVPILANPKQFEFRTDECNEKNTIVFDFHVKHPGTTKTPIPVHSKSLVWIPQGDQAKHFADTPIRVAMDDILVAKLAPGQEIQMELHCEKNIGKEHAKWSPVSTATYRLFPMIQITSPITGPDAHQFASCFPKGVIGIQKKRGIDTAIVLDPRKDTVSRECLRYPEFADKVVLGRNPNHYIFVVESTGSLLPNTIVLEAISVLIEKCNTLDHFLNAIQTQQH